MGVYIVLTQMASLLQRCYTGYSSLCNVVNDYDYEIEYAATGYILLYFAEEIVEPYRRHLMSKWHASLEVLTSIKKRVRCILALAMGRV
jgi:hypothetical protein